MRGAQQRAQRVDHRPALPPSRRQATPMCPHPRSGDSPSNHPNDHRKTVPRRPSVRGRPTEPCRGATRRDPQITSRPARTSVPAARLRWRRFRSLLAAGGTGLEDGASSASVLTACNWAAACQAAWGDAFIDRSNRARGSLQVSATDPGRRSPVSPAVVQERFSCRRPDAAPEASSSRQRKQAGADAGKSRQGRGVASRVLAATI